MEIKKGSILTYRIFDIAHEINLSVVEELLQNGSIERYRFARVNNSVLIKDAPLNISLGSGGNIKILSYNLETSLTAKIWDYGVVSMQLEIFLPSKEFSFDDLIKVGAFLEDNDIISVKLKEQKEILKRKISKALVKENNNWTTFEDYTTYYLREIEGLSSAEEALTKLPIAQLILAEDKLKASKSQVQHFKENYLQYSEQDLLIIDWNSCLLIDFTEDQGLKECADVIEFSLTHALELRRYDDLLSEKINILSDWFEKRQKFFKRPYLSHSLYQETNQTYIEYSEFFDRVDNSFKTIGDFYYAIVFRVASRKFRLEDWKKSTSSKLSMINDLADKLDSERHNKKAILLDLVIIFLFLVETYPFFVKAFNYFTGLFS